MGKKKSPVSIAVGVTESWFVHNVDMNNRIIYMGSLVTPAGDDEPGVNFMMAESVIKGLMALDVSAPEGDEPITIIMNNPGGDWYHGMAIYDAIKSCRNKTRIIVYGMAMSMGAVILQAADERILAPNARFMIHNGYSGFYGHALTAMKQAEENKVITKVMENVLSSKSKVSVAELRRMLRFDTFLSAEETVKLGFADAVLEVKA